jgi:hypothetical protein
VPSRRQLGLHIDQDWKDETEAIEAAGELTDLPGRMPAGLAAERLAFRNLHEPRGQIA